MVYKLGSKNEEQLSSIMIIIIMVMVIYGHLTIEVN